MTSFRFAVNVTPKPGILDPAGRAVEGSLGHLGIDGIHDVRIGRRAEMTVDAADEAAARAVVERLAGELLSNPLIEAFTVEPLGAASSAVSAGARGRLLMPVRIGVVVFPGSNCDRDTVHALHLAGADPVVLWHEQATLEGVAAVVLPGGFAYGDYVRAGVIARFSPVMRAVSAFAADGGLVLGICNGFQVLAEAGLVPGALLRNASLRFAGQEVAISAERLDTRFTHALASHGPLRMPVAHGEGRYYADDATLDALEADGQVLFRYVDDASNPNGSLRAIAGVMNAAGNVAGLMPHPERASEAILGSADGFGIIRSLVESAARAANEPAAVGTAAAGSR